VEFAQGVRVDVPGASDVRALTGRAALRWAWCVQSHPHMGYMSTAVERPERASRVRAPTPTVLVVDDSGANRALASAALEDDDFRVVLAADGEAALAAFERVHPHCIVLDIQMPGMDGVAVCRRIRELPGGARVAIVFVTAQHDVDTFDRSVAAGGDDFVTKPYRPSELAVRVRTALRLRSVAQERDELYELIKQQRDDLQRLQLQMRDANERLVIETANAGELAAAANAERAAASLNEERFRTLVRTSSALVWRAAADGRIQVDADAWRGFTGVEVEPHGWGWLEAVHSDERNRVRDAWTSAVTTVTPYACEHRIRNRDGGYAWVVARAAPIVTPGAEPEWIGMFSDISDRVRVEEARERFIAILGHDLRTPLSAILMGVELLGDLPRPEADTVARIGRSAHRMEAMIRDVLDFARGRLGGGIPVVPRSIDLGQICRDLVDEMKQAYPARKISFEAVGELGGRWDPDRAEQVLSNLLGNAVKHGVGPIVVTSRDEGNAVVTTIHNQGPPIPAALMPTLFDPFTGTSNDAKPGPQGLGLGLYIASEIVHAHGGTISVTSVEDEGTTFAIRWPRKSEPRT